jgi:pimeloyl-ACP methyl ester carboxylesterase
MTSRRSVLSLVGAAALGGFATGRRATVREAEAERTFPPLGRMVEVNGRKVHALTEGQGPDVVLIHGAGGNLRDFTFDLMARLTRHYRVTAMDRPGLGWSDPIDGAEDPRVQGAHLAAAAAALGLSNPVVLGHSYGGAVAMGWALSAPETIRGLVTVSAPLLPWPGGLDSWYHLTGSAWGSVAVVPLITAFATEAQAQASLAATFAPSPVPAGYGDHLGIGLTLRRATLRENGRQVLGLKPQVTAMQALYPGLPVPVEVIHGTADLTVFASVHAEPVSGLLPSARLTLIPEAGHMPHHSHPGPILEAVRRLAH